MIPLMNPTWAHNYSSMSIDAFVGLVFIGILIETCVIALFLILRSDDKGNTNVSVAYLIMMVVVANAISGAVGFAMLGGTMY